MDSEELSNRIVEIKESEARLRRTVEALEALEALEDDGLGAPSQCTGWTRGHVLAHVALNAHSLVNLFEWAQTGDEKPQYAGRAERAADIERYAERNVTEHLAALDLASAAFSSAAEAMPLDRWGFHVSGLGGRPVPVAVYLIGRLREVEIHHVDLDAGYGPNDWQASFVRQTLEGVPDRIGDDVEEPFEVEATDLGLRLKLGARSPRATVYGSGSELLHWLLGRGSGEGLRSGTSRLPDVPSWG